MEKKVKFIQKLQNFSNEITQSVTSKAEYLEKLENELNQLFLIQKESPEQVLEDYFEKFNKNDWKIFWLSYQHVIEYLISNLIQNNDLNDDNNNNNHNNPLEKQKYCQKLYEFCSFLLQNYQEIKIKTDSFYNIMELLHNILLILLPINNNEKNIQKLKECKLLISRLCEKLWFDQDTNANRYITQLIPYLLLHALDSTSHESDIKRIYHLKDTFNEFDYEDSSIDTIRGLLLRCFVDVKFLKVRRRIMILMMICIGCRG